MKRISGYLSTIYPDAPQGGGRDSDPTKNNFNTVGVGATYYLLSTARKRAAFTLIELVIFTAIFTVTITAFISVLISITRTSVRQSSVAEVNQQSQFILQAVQYYVERSAVIEIPADVATTSVKLRMRDMANEDPVLIYSSGTVVYAKIASNPAMALTSGKVTVSNFLLARRTNYPGKDSLSVSFNISYNTSNIEQQFAQGIQSAVARVSAATFDSNVTPSTDNTYTLGANGAAWQSINGAIYFNGSNVGIGGGSPPTSLLQIHGGDIYIDDSSRGVVFNTGSNCYRLKLSGTGGISTSSTSCPP